MSIERWVDKEVVVHIYNGIILSHKKEWIWVGWTETDEPRACYAEWSKSEKYIYHILMHIYGISKNGTEEPICRAGLETKTCRMDMWTQQGEEEGGTNWEISTEIHTLPCVK